MSSCPTYMTSNGLQIGGIDPNTVSKTVEKPTVEETKTDFSEITDRIVEVAEKRAKTVRKTTKKATTKRK